MSGNGVMWNNEQEVFEFLDSLRDSGVINMFGASDHIIMEYGCDKNAARNILVKWMETYSERH